MIDVAPSFQVSNFSIFFWRFLYISTYLPDFSWRYRTYLDFFVLMICARHAQDIRKITHEDLVV
jgi:hypothetical protein